MNKEYLGKIIIKHFEEVYRSQIPDGDLPILTEETVLLNTGMDSLGFAILVTMLDADLDYDPFTLSDIAYYPQTLGEFINFYVENYPR